MTIAQQLNVKDFPFFIKDKQDKEIYREWSDGLWLKREYNANGYQTRFEDSDGFWWKKEYNANSQSIGFENSNGYWEKSEYNADGYLIYHENSCGLIKDNRPKVELTLDEVATKFGIDVNQLKIKK
jgi:hypothetical protein